MKLKLLLLALSLSSICVAQVAFQNISLKQALALAKSESRILFLQVESKDCKSCNEKADRSLRCSELADKINETFIPVKIRASSVDRALIDSKYDMSKSLGILFIDGEGTLIHKMSSFSSSPSVYSKAIDEALLSGGESLKLSALEAEYNRGNRSPGFMEAYLLKRSMLGLHSGTLLDEYVALLPLDSLRSIRTLVFIANMAPERESKADAALRVRPYFTQAWATIPSHIRSRINSLIIRRSLQKAVAGNDEDYALRIARFSKNVYGKNIESGNNAYTRNMMLFYKETNDTTQYFEKAIDYYNGFMTLSKDSVQRKDSLLRLRIVQMPPHEDPVINKNRARVKESNTFNLTAVSHSFELAQGAFDFYKKTKNPYLISIATEWVKKGLEFYTTSEALSTYAHLLYRQGYKEKAIKTIREVIVLRKKERFPVGEYELLADKMDKGAAVD